MIAFGMSCCVVLWDWIGTLVSSGGNPIAGAESALRHWAGKAQCAIVTNGIESCTTSEARSFGWSRYIKCIQGGEDFQKPDPRIILSALKRLGVPSGECVVMIGDRQTDRQCALDAGCGSLLVGVDVTLKELTQMSEAELLRAASARCMERSGLLVVDMIANY